MAGSHTPIEVFCSYAHEDEPLLQQLAVHLSLLKRQGLISTWHDRQIPPAPPGRRPLIPIWSGPR